MLNCVNLYCNAIYDPIILHLLIPEIIRHQAKTEVAN